MARESLLLRETLYGFVGLVAALFVSVLVSLCATPAAILLIVPLTALLFGRRCLAARDETPVRTRGELRYAGGWRFVDANGSTHRAAANSGSLRWRVGPAIAHVYPSLGDAVACAPIATDDDDELRLIQRGLDAFFGVSASDREEMARRAVPRSVRLRAWFRTPFANDAWDVARATEVTEVVGPAVRSALRRVTGGEVQFSPGHRHPCRLLPDALRRDAVGRRRRARLRRRAEARHRRRDPRSRRLPDAVHAAEPRSGG